MTIWLNGVVLPYNVQEILLDYDHKGSLAEELHQYPYPDYVLTSTDPIVQALESSTFRVNSQSLEIIYDLLEFLYQDYQGPFYSDMPPLGYIMKQSLYNGNNVSQTMSNIADMVTIHIRTGHNITNIYGAASYPEIYVVVRWRWFILPGLLVLLTVVFFALTAWDSRSKNGGTPLWKSNVLPYLFHGLDGWTEEELSVSSSREGMEVVAEKMFARIMKNDEGVRKFVRVYKRERGVEDDGEP